MFGRVPVPHLQAVPVQPVDRGAQGLAVTARAVEGLDARFITAVLNSRTLTDWHRAAHRDARQRAFPQVKVGHLAAAPFPIAHRREDPPLHDALVAAYGDGPVVDQMVAAAFGVTPSRTDS